MRIKLIDPSLEGLVPAQRRGHYQKHCGRNCTLFRSPWLSDWNRTNLLALRPPLRTVLCVWLNSRRMTVTQLLSGVAVPCINKLVKGLEPLMCCYVAIFNTGRFHHGRKDVYQHYTSYSYWLSPRPCIPVPAHEFIFYSQKYWKGNEPFSPAAPPRQQYC